ncbi:hypothetical protein GJ496_010743 [Pomphorhynchus laevis]|nr:hypothetical protein GJ496_010743 [Pomphorhynchus laevis]
MHSDVRGNPPFTRMMLEPQSHNHDSYNPYCCQRTNNQDFTQLRGANICQSKLRNQCRCKCVKDPQPHDVLCDQANNSRVEELCSVDCYSNSYLNHQNHQIHKPNQQLHFCSCGAPSIQRRDACICTGSVGACMKNASTALSTNEYPRQHDVYYQARFASTDHNDQNPYHVNKQMSSSDDSSSLDDESSWNFSSVQPQQHQQRHLPSNKLVGDALSASQNQRTDRLGLLPSTTCLKSKQRNHGIVVNPGKRRQLQYNNDPFHQQYHNRDDDKFHLMPVRVHENNMSTLPRKKLLNLKEECQRNVDSNNRLSNCDFAYHQMPSSDDNSSRRRCDGAVSTEIACDNAESAGCHSYGVRVCYLDEDMSLVDNSVEYEKTTAHDGSNGQSGHCDTTTVGKGNYDKNAIFVVSGSGGDSVVGMKSVTFGNTNVSGKVKLLRGVNTSTEHTQIPVVDKNNNQMHQTGSESCGAKSSKALSSNSGRKHQQSTQKNCIIS